MRILSVVAVASVSLVMGVRGADDLVITESGTTTLPSGAHTYGQIRNEVSANEVTVAQEGSDWNTFSTFEAVTVSTTKLDNVRFDFGSAGTDTMNIFGTAGTGFKQRYLEIGNGSVVTNVGRLIVTRAGGASDRDNAIHVTGQSSLHVSSAVIAYYSGVYQANNRASFTLDGGSVLNCAGSFQAGNASSMGDTTCRDLDVRFAFSDAGTKATIGGTLSVGAGSAYGGHHGLVTDGAEVSAATVSIGATGNSAQSFDNSLVVSNGACLVSKGFNLSTSYAVPYGGRPVGDSFQVLDGGAYTNTGNFYVGWNDSSNKGKWGASILVSNGTFRTTGGDYRFGTNLACSNLVFTVSGPRAKVHFSGGSYYYFCPGPYNRYIFENHAAYETGYTAFSYTTSVSDEEIRVRTGATFGFNGSSGFKIAAVGNSATVSNSRFVVESGAMATGTVFRVGGRNNTLAVSNALVRVSGHPNFLYALDIGDAASGAVNKNAHLILSGDAPKIVSPGMVQIANESDITFELPAGGYADGIIPVTLDNSFNLNSGCSLNLTGAEKMLAVHQENKCKRSYTLIKALTVSVPDAEIERVNGTLPRGMALRKVYDGSIAREMLILDVKPKYGLALIIR